MDEPAYTLRVSPRARRLHLVVSATEGLTVVVPPRFDRSRIAPLLAARREWIERAQGRFEAERRHLEQSRAAGPPSALRLEGLGENWRLRYDGRPGTTVRTRRSVAGQLVLEGCVSDDDLVAAALQRFVARRVLEVLGPELETMARARGLSIGNVAVRAQRTRWASCSTTGSISLNRNLAFLPRRLVHLVLVHELCHRREMNHSPAFWRLLDAEIPDRRALDAELLDAWSHVPYWARA